MALRSLQSRQQSSDTTNRNVQDRSRIGSFDRNSLHVGNGQGNNVALRHWRHRASTCEKLCELPKTRTAATYRNAEYFRHVRRLCLVPQEGFEPPTPSLRMTCSTG
jgi:hypothetical protein